MTEQFALLAFDLRKQPKDAMCGSDESSSTILFDSTIGYYVDYTFWR